MSESVPRPAATETPALVVLPDDVIRTPAGEPAVVLVRTARGWTPLTVARQCPLAVPEPAPDAVGAPERPEALPLVQAMSLGDLVAEAAGVAPEPGRAARLAARGAGTPAPSVPEDPRDVEIAALRRTVGQLEHALAARVSIERAIGVLAERHGMSPRDAFDDLRRRARSKGRPAQELAREVLDGLAERVAVPDPLTPPADATGAVPDVVVPVPGVLAVRESAEPDCTDVDCPPTARRVTRPRQPAPPPGSGAEARS